MVVCFTYHCVPFSFAFGDKHGCAPLYCFKENLVVLFLLHVVGVEGLHGVGFELVVAVEGGVEAEELLGVEVNDCVNQLFGDALFKAEQKCAVGDGEEFFASDGFGFDVAGQSKSGFEEDVDGLAKFAFIVAGFGKDGWEELFQPGTVFGGYVERGSFHVFGLVLCHSLDNVGFISSTSEW